MRIVGILTIVGLVALALVGCGGSKPIQEAATGDVPEWFTNVPTDPNYLFAANTASSQDLQLAIDKATTGARTEIGRQVETRIQGLQKRFDEETGVGENQTLLQQFTQASKTVVSTSLTGSRVRTQQQLKDGNLWRSYVLVEYPIGAANEALMQQIKSQNEMYTRFRSTQTFKELDEEVQKYEEWKKQQMK